MIAIYSMPGGGVRDIQSPYYFFFCHRNLISYVCYYSTARISSWKHRKRNVVPNLVAARRVAWQNFSWNLLLAIYEAAENHLHELSSLVCWKGSYFWTSAFVGVRLGSYFSTSASDFCPRLCVSDLGFASWTSAFIYNVWMIFEIFELFLVTLTYKMDQWTTIFSSVDDLIGLNNKEFHKMQCTDFVISIFKHKFFSVNTIIWSNYFAMF